MYTCIYIYIYIYTCDCVFVCVCFLLLTLLPNARSVVFAGPDPGKKPCGALPILDTLQSGVQWEGGAADGGSII